MTRSNSLYAKIIVDIASDAVDRLFDYRIPETFVNQIQPGHRVLVPFGFREKEGYVIEISGSTQLEEKRIKDIIAPLEPYPALTSDLMILARELSQSLHCTLCEALRLMLPAQMRGGKVRIKTEPCLQIAFPKEKLDEVISSQKRSPKRRLILSILGDGLVHPCSDIKSIVSAPEEPVSALKKQGLVLQTQREIYRKPFRSNVLKRADEILTEEQTEVYNEVKDCIDQGKTKTFLLQGVTGSGKTEVYIHLARKTIQMGKSVIILVPEIALTPQMTDYFYSRFNDRIAILHSRLSSGERYDEWRRIRSGQADVVIGARSAVFAPLENLGLIIIDEEHETTYLSEKHPQYDARIIAHRRCEMNSSPLLLASATPSIYSYAMAQKGAYTLLEMPHRIHQLPLPEIHIADMREELKAGNRSIFSRIMKEKLTECVRSGEQAILFVNRRGYAPFMNCRSCGETIKCERCDVSLTYHKADNLLHCHYCGTVYPVPTSCPFCSSKYIRTCGIGTQKVEEETHALFPDVGIIRMDLDTTARKGSHEKLTNDFRAGKAQILIGTQMIAKGLDFPSVTFVGVILADMTLNLPDYRSPERTYQLLVQVAGRAGRKDKRGSVVVQTYKPDHYAVQSSVQQDYRAFFREEFQKRRSSLYPPFTQMDRVLFEGNDQDTVLGAALDMEKNILSFAAAESDICRKLIMHRTDMSPIQRIQNRYRAQILFKIIDQPVMNGFLGYIQSSVDSFNRDRSDGVTAEFEINPSSLA